MRKPRLVVKPPPVAAKTELPLPWSVKSLAVAPTVVVALAPPIAKAPAAAVSIEFAPTFRPLTAVAVSVPPDTLPPLRVPAETVPPEIVAPLMVPVQAKLPEALVTVQPVEAEPPPRRMSPVLVAPKEIVLAPLASIVKAPVPLMAVPDTLSPSTAVPVSVPPLTVPPDNVPPLMVALLIVEPPVVKPPGRLTTRPALPNVSALALVPATVMVPVVLFVEVPVSTVRLPETEAPPVPEALPVVILRLAEGVAAVATFGVWSKGACKAVVKKPLPKGLAVEPMSALPLLAGRRLVLIATEVRLDKAVLAPPPPPPRQFPAVVHIV
jgi:hypothetical protein